MKKILLICCTLATLSIYPRYNWPQNYPQLFANNLEDDKMFRLGMLVNAGHNFFNASQQANKKKGALPAIGSCALGTASIITSITYPSLGNWSIYSSNHMRRNKALVLAIKIINTISCIDAICKYFKIPVLEAIPRSFIFGIPLAKTAGPWVTPIMKKILKLTL